ncbi:MAG: PQQ-binding-like beta-propeller repeat protein [Candidatus Cohnella colombiensis]|uniref:PQQ-binding-like beta-propeller repeat protein n=1 Tax=Candidatus Cohnella colombiensis TaxID=3121368 RepID=A0AA95JFF1_9BACL|nr:MAG: PQQ-binding-like beta-propeller repeat protein [Cohnella sp.]
MKKLSVVVAVCLVASIMSACAQEKKSESSMFRGDLKHTGLFDTKGPVELHGVKWKFQTKDKVRTSPVIALGTVYFGSDDGQFYAVNATTGTQSWAFKTEGAIKSSAAVIDQTVYFLSGDRKLYALNAEDGKLIWSYETAEQDEPRDIVDYWQSSPAVSDGNVYFGGGEGNFYAVDANTGKLAWKKKLALDGYKYDKGLVPILHSSPAIDKGVIYMGLSGYDMSKSQEPGNVVALDAKTGDQLWVSPLLNAVDSSITVDDKALYFGMRNGGIASLDKQTGKYVWRGSQVQYLLGSMAISGDTLFSGSSDGHVLVALEAATGKQKWSLKTVDAIHASPATDGETVYVACGNHYTEDNHGLIYAVDAKTGEQIWTYQTGGNVYSSPALDQGVLFIGSDDGYMYAIH